MLCLQAALGLKWRLGACHAVVIALTPAERPVRGPVQRAALPGQLQAHSLERALLTQQRPALGIEFLPLAALGAGQRAQGGCTAAVCGSSHARQSGKTDRKSPAPRLRSQPALAKCLAFAQGCSTQSISLQSLFTLVS